MKIQLKQPNSKPSKPLKRRNRTIAINNNTYMAGIWTKTVERGRKCQSCRREISAGEPSLRYIRKDMQYGKYDIQSEKAICSTCAIPAVKLILADLEQPIDQNMFIRMKKNQPQPTSKW